MSKLKCHSHESKTNPSAQAKITCPECNGSKIVKGVCSCNMEWRGNKIGDQWEDCQCTPEITCPECGGTGLVAAG